MIIRKSDFTNCAISVGVWQTLKELANINLNDCEDDDAEIVVTACKENK